jgi:trehalose 6-phosphate phosphatase
MELFCAPTVVILMQTELVANDAALDVFAGVDPNNIALLLDIDGTIIDLGPTPFEVDVPEELRTTLSQLFELTQGAIALVSGRPIKDIDLLFSPLRLPAIGGHGAELRVRTQVHNIAPALSEEFRAQLVAAAELRPGIVVEDKRYSVALHYRRVPQHETWLVRYIAKICNDFPGESTEVLSGKMMFEVKRPAINKGESVRHLMKLAPFKGRKPVFIGDDVTDESVFEVMPDFGGMGFSVARDVEGLTGIFKSPGQVRRALRRLVNGQTH